MLDQGLEDPQGEVRWAGSHAWWEPWRLTPFRTTGAVLCVALSVDPLTRGNRIPFMLGTSQGGPSLPKPGEVGAWGSPLFCPEHGKVGGRVEGIQGLSPLVTQPALLP